MKRRTLKIRINKNRNIEYPGFYILIGENQSAA